MLNKKKYFETIELISKGYLTSCWGGKFYYLEPWVGCECDCHYCYKRSRQIVKNTLEQYSTAINHPVPLYPQAELLEKISKEIQKDNVNILVLGRYTDIFTPRFVKNGLAYKVLKTVCESQVKRIVITTKGVPSKNIIDLIKRNKGKFSYNAVVKPECEEKILEPGIAPSDERLNAAGIINKAGVLTSVHMDPLVMSLKLRKKDWVTFFNYLKSFGINRVMFSYLMLDKSIISHLRNKLDANHFREIMDCFDIDREYLYSYMDEGAIFIKPKIRKAHAVKVSRILKEQNLEFAICYLKSANDKIWYSKEKCELCDGSFYA